jgi:hypothetical protein
MFGCHLNNFQSNQNLNYFTHYIEIQDMVRDCTFYFIAANTYQIEKIRL